MLRGYFEEDSVFEKTFISASLVFLEIAKPEKVDLVVYCLSCEFEENGELLSALDVRTSIELRKRMHNTLAISMRRQMIGIKKAKCKDLPFYVQNMMLLSVELLLAAHSMIKNLRKEDRFGLTGRKIANILSEYSNVLNLEMPKHRFLKKIFID